MDAVYHVRIKKDYAAAVLEDLEKMEAVELVKEADVDDEVPLEVQEELIARDKEMDEDLKASITLDELKAHFSVAVK